LNPGTVLPDSASLYPGYISVDKKDNNDMFSISGIILERKIW